MPPGSWHELFGAPSTEPHIVQLYRDPGFLGQAVAAWVAPVLTSGGSAVLLCTQENADRTRRELQGAGIDPAPLEAEGRLIVLDATETLAAILADGSPDEARTKQVIGDVLKRARGPEGREVRAWGELVNVLWHDGNRAAAQRLEAIWNDIIAEHGIRLLCSYQVDNLDPETHTGALKHVCAGHTHLIPEPDYERFEIAVTRALVDVFGEREAHTVHALFSSRRSVPTQMPSAEAILVALHDLQPLLGKRVLRSTKLHLASLGGA